MYDIEVENHQESRPQVHVLLFQDTVSSFFCADAKVLIAGGHIGSRLLRMELTTCPPSPH